jgi:hypothetical protein
MHAIPRCFSAARAAALEFLDVEPRAAKKQKMSRGCSSCYKQATPLGFI